MLRFLLYRLSLIACYNYGEGGSVLLYDSVAKSKFCSNRTHYLHYWSYSNSDGAVKPGLL